MVMLSAPRKFLIFLQNNFLSKLANPGSNFHCRMTGTAAGFNWEMSLILPFFFLCYMSTDCGKCWYFKVLNIFRFLTRTNLSRQLNTFVTSAFHTSASISFSLGEVMVLVTGPVVCLLCAQMCFSPCFCGQSSPSRKPA